MDWFSPRPERPGVETPSRHLGAERPPRAENQALFKKYEALAATRPEVAFVGRLATYRYYNMDQVTGQALAAWRRLKPLGQAAPGIEEAAIVGA